MRQIIGIMALVSFVLIFSGLLLGFVTNHQQGETIAQTFYAFPLWIKFLVIGVVLYFVIAIFSYLLD